MAIDADLYGKSTILETWAVQPRFSAILIGSLICLALQMFLGLLATGLGVSPIHLETWQTIDRAGLISGAFLAFSLGVSFFLGGYVAGRLANQPFRISTLLHGMGAWALVSVFLLCFAEGSGFPSFVKGMIKQASITDETMSLITCVSLFLGGFSAFLGALAARRPLVASSVGYTAQRPVPKVA